MKHKSILKPQAKSKSKINFILVLIIATLTSYSPVLFNDFINLDDPQYILDNTDIQSFNIHNLKRLFTSTYVGNYQPVTMLSYMIEYTLLGAKPAMFHFTNLILHLLNALLVYLIFIRLINNKTISFVTALLFSIHPLHVESVAWASARKDVMYTLFFLSSAFYYLKYVHDKNNKYLVLSLILFVLSILSKAQAVVLPMVLLLFDFLQKRKINKQTIADKTPFFLLSFLFGALAFYIQNKSGAVQDFTYFPFVTRILFACYGLVGYLWKLLLPINLSCFYPYPETNDVINTNWVYAAPIIILVISVAIYKYVKKSREVIFGILFFIVTISLVLQLIPVGDAVMADRYSYIPFIGLFFIAGHFYNSIFEYKRKSALVKPTGIIITIALSVLSFIRSSEWENSITLYTSSLNNYPAAIIYNNRGAALAAEGKNEEALDDFNNVLKLKPRYPNGHQNRGITLQKLNKYEEAIIDFSEEIKINPKNMAAYNNRGNCYKALNKYKEAIDDYNSILKINPNNLDAIYSRGESYGRSGNLKQTIADFNTVIAAKPDYAEAYSNRGIAYSLSGKTEQALEDFKKAIELKPNAYNTYLNRAVALKSIGKYKEALADAMYAKKNGQAIDDTFIKELELLAGK